MVELDLDGKSLILRAPLVTTSKAREIPGARHDNRARAWRLPLAWASCVTARGIYGNELQVTQAVIDWAESELANRINPALQARQMIGEAREHVPGELYQFQKVGAHFLDVAGSALLADEMGIGKTVQTIAALEDTGSYPALIVCPTTVKSVWEREFARWSMGRRVVVAQSGTASAEKAVAQVAAGEADVLVIGWEAIRTLSKLAGYGSTALAACQDCDMTSTMKNKNNCERHNKALNLIPWVAVVADEAHRAKTPSAKQTRALWALGDSARRRYALTGTPIANAPDDLWAVMRFVSPDEYPVKGKWVERYASVVPNLYSGGFDVIGFRPDRREEFDRIFLPRFLRRTKEQVLTELPPKTYERRDITLSPKQKKAYETMAKDMVAALEGGTTAATETLIWALRLRQLASAFGEIAEDGKILPVEPSSKLDEMEAVIEDLGGKQCVIFAESAELIKLAFARIKNSGRVDAEMIIGEVPGDLRGAIVERFQKGETRILLATVGAAGEGITLTAADTAIFLQRPWSAVLNAQAEDRLHRAGQTAQNVTYIDIVATGTIEERVFEALRGKADKLQDLVKDADALKWYQDFSEGQ